MAFGITFILQGASSTKRGTGTRGAGQRCRKAVARDEIGVGGKDAGPSSSTWNAGVAGCRVRLAHTTNCSILGQILLPLPAGTVEVIVEHFDIKLGDHVFDRPPRVFGSGSRFSDTSADWWSRTSAFPG